MATADRRRRVSADEPAQLVFLHAHRRACGPRGRGPCGTGLGPVEDANGRRLIHAPGRRRWISAARSGTFSAASGCSCSRSSRCTDGGRGFHDGVTWHTTATHTLTRWNGGVCPFDAGWRKVMMWWFIVTDGLLFAGFLSALRLRAAAGGPLARSGVGVQPAVHRGYDIRADLEQRHDGERGAGGAGGAAKRRAAVHGPDELGGAFFLGMQAFEWRHLITEGASLERESLGRGRIRRVLLPAHRLSRHARAHRRRRA